MTMTPIFTQTVGASGAASVTFSNIGQQFTDLQLIVSSRTSEAVSESTYFLRFNGNTTSGYTRRVLYGTGSGAGSYSATETGMKISVNGSSSTSTTFNNDYIYIPNYTASSVTKVLSVDNVLENNATFGVQALM